MKITRVDVASANGPRTGRVNSTSPRAENLITTEYLSFPRPPRYTFNSPLTTSLIL
jgi:hypothetical protein